MKKYVLILFLSLIFFSIASDANNSQIETQSINIQADCITQNVGVDDQASEQTQKREVDDYISEITGELLDGLDVSGLDEVYSDYEFFQGKGTAKNRIIDLISGNYNLGSGNFLSEVFNFVFGGVGEVVAELSIIIAIALITALSKAIKPAFMDKSLSELSFFVCFIVVVGIVATRFISIYKSATDTIESMEKQLDVAFPLLLTLIASSGGGVSASVYQPQVAFLIKGMSSVIKGMLLPITLLLFIFCVVGRMSDKIKVDKMRDFLKSAFKWIAGLTVVIFNFLVTAQGITSSVYDGISIKALKYALGNSIPLVGNLVSGGFDAVLASTILIKNAIGSFAMIGLLMTAILPVIKIAIFSLFLRLAAAITEPIADGKICSFLSVVADTSGYVTATLVVCASSYIITILMIVCSLGGAF